ncbi:MAG: protein-glutamate O-methyltransferase CheR [Eubacterium sp.]|nr:protein-glutamate O-methyltransferase CheR [Eubacterium sp.]
MRIDDRDFDRLVNYIKDAYGINLEGKRALVEGRLGSMLTERGFNGYTEYLDRCFMDLRGSEMQQMVNSLTTNHTFFMREPEHFTFLNDTVLPHMVRKNSAKRSMRIWSAGCSSGEEAYTAAMFISEYLGREKHYWDTRILATDISVKILAAAQNGVYPRKSAQQLPDGWVDRYFTDVDGERIKISKEIRDGVIFKMFNLMDEIPFKKEPFDLIFCRNVMIYFEKETRAKLLERFYDVLRPGGYLFIGHSEGIPREMKKFEYIAPAVYRKPLD